MSAQALPDPSGFRTLHVIERPIAAMLAARMIRDGIDFNYSRLDGAHQFVYPVCHYRQVMELQRELQ